jgi:hypothetical protein
MHKSATKCNETLGKWCKNKHGASKIIDTFETYHLSSPFSLCAQPSWWAFKGEALGGYEEKASARKKKQWQRWRNRELVNSKNNSHLLINFLRKERGPRLGTWSGRDKPTNGQKNCKITMLPMCNSQCPGKSSQRMTPSMMSRISNAVDKVISRRNNLRLWLFPRELTHSLGGYYYQKHRSPTWRNERLPTQRNEKKHKTFAGYDDARITRSKYFWAYTQTKYFRL